MHRFLEYWVGLCVIALAACADETPGEVVRIAWELERNGAGENADFETDTGFAVHLETAQVALAAIYAYSPLPGSVGAVAQLSDVLRLTSVAHAHGGLDPETGRRVKAEQLTPLSVDLLDPEPLTLPRSEAEAGRVEAVKLELAPTGQGLPSELGGGAAYVRGVARREGTPDIAFEAAVTLPEAKTGRSVDLTGLRETLAEGCLLQVGINPQVWLRQADFSRLADASADSDEPARATPDDQVGRALAIAVRSPDAFTIHVSLER